MTVISFLAVPMESEELWPFLKGHLFQKKEMHEDFLQNFLPHIFQGIKLRHSIENNV